MAEPSPVSDPPQDSSASTTVPELTGITPFQIGEHLFHRRVSKNGLTALAVREETPAKKAAEGDVPTVSVFLAVDAGRRYETAATHGLAHLTEHALYTGTARVAANAHDARIHELGGESNATTRDDYVLIYDHEVPASALDEILTLEADRLRGLSFDRAAVLHERDRLTLEEARTFTRAMAREERLEAAAFDHHPYGVGVLEEKDGVFHSRGPTLSVEQIHAFYDAHYHPNRVVVMVAGQVDPTSALASVEQAFGSLTAGPSSPAVSEEPDKKGVSEHAFESQLGADRLEWIWLGPALGHPDRPALGLLARWLARQSTRDGSPVQASLGGRLDRDLFRLASTGGDAEASLAELLRRVRDELVPAEDVAELRTLSADAYTSLELRGRPYFSLASEVAIHALHGHLDAVLTHSEAIQALTPEALQKVARRWLDPERRTAVRFIGSGEADRALPEDPGELRQLAIDASESGELELAIRAYTQLLEGGPDGGPNAMNTVIYLASRGQVRMEQRDYAGAILDFEEALAVVDYPAVRDLLEEARALEMGALRRSSSSDAPTTAPSPEIPSDESPEASPDAIPEETPGAFSSDSTASLSRQLTARECKASATLASSAKLESSAMLRAAVERTSFGAGRVLHPVRTS